ncbi:MAG: 16S rRNA (cytosine(1402)-N(4))-methyltransferase RsmH [Acidobacteriota bacterium]|nr:16S rRNA (cytosine(1402)-N(4))-methyltransferase RsmH [Acidobacteriota bacterium]
MAQDTYHTPVFEREVVELLSAQPPGVVVDATLGGGGHADAGLRVSPHVRLIGIDRDPAARAAARARLAPYGARVAIVGATFGDLARVVDDQHAFVAGEPIVGVLMDLGVSSRQLDDVTRGFSFRADAPLDMRMDPTRGETAAHYLARVDPHELVRVLRENGEGRFAGAIARSIVASKPTTTGELAAAVERAVPPASRRRGHVATRVFQAVRTEVNDEAGQLSRGLDAALDVLSPGGVLIVIAYHSGEDRAVKAAFHEAATGGCQCPVELGCVCGAVPRATVSRASAVLASALEIAANPRARSARLRIARKVAP